MCPLCSIARLRKQKKKKKKGLPSTRRVLGTKADSSPATYFFGGSGAYFATTEWSTDAPSYRGKT